MNVAPFPDLTQEAAAVRRRETLYEGSVDGKKATLEVEAETNGEMYVSGDDFVVILITICHHRF